MNQLTHQRLKSAFESAGLSDKDYINKNTLTETLDQLGREQFDSDILDQLWEQCKLNSQGKTKIDTFIDNILRAELILLQKQKETLMAIANLQFKLSKEVNTTEIININSQIDQLKQVQTGFTIDLQILRKPFLKFSKIDGENINSNSQENQNDENFFISPAISNKMNLTWVMDISLFCLFLQMFINLYINSFMNTVLFLLILSLCLFQYFDTILVRLLFWGTTFTIIVDIVWYCIQAHSLWNHQNNGRFASFVAGYIKFSIVLISVVFLLKFIIAILLCSEYNIDDTRHYEINLFSKKIILKKQKPSPIRIALEHFIKRPNSKSENSHVKK